LSRRQHAIAGTANPVPGFTSLAVDVVASARTLGTGRPILHVVVIGCGRVGSELAGALELGGHSVSIVDKNARAFRRLGSGFAGRTVVGFGFDRDHLGQAGIEDAGAFASVTNGDNSNILCARIARETYNIEHVVARIYDPRRALIYQRLGISTVATVSWTTDQVMRRLLPAEEQPHEWLDPSGKVCLLDYPIPAKWAGKKLAPLSEPGVFWLVAITRLGAAQVSTPSAIGQDGDILHFAADVSALDTLRHRLEHGEEHH
jgi:trk system potassium uptake protein TrkA